MNIAATQYTLNNEALEIYLSGCSGIDGEHCKNCHNPELWDYSVGTLCNETVSEKIKEKIINNAGLIKRVMIMGGEPLDQDSDELLKFINDIRIEGIEYWLFTRREIEEIPTEILINFDYIKTGKYNPDLSDKKEMYGITLASSNQMIYKIS